MGLETEAQISAGKRESQLHTWAVRPYRPVLHQHTAQGNTTYLL